MTSFFIRTAESLRKNRKKTLVFLVLLTLVPALFILKSRVDNSLPVWQSKDDIHWIQYQQFMKHYELTNPLVIYLPNIDTYTMSGIAATLHDEITVQAIQSQIVHDHGKTQGLIFISPLPGATPAELAKLLNTVKNILSRYEKPFHLGGVWYLTVLLDQLSADSTRTLFPVVLLLLCITTWYFIRNRTNTALVLACGLLPALQITGLMAAVGLSLNMVLLTLPPMTMILGIAHAIHFVTKVKDNRKPDPVELFAQVAPPCLLSGITTMFGFLSLLFAGYQPVRELGFWGAVATVLALLNAFILLPVLFCPQTRVQIKISRNFTAFLARFRFPVLGFFLLAAVLAGTGIHRLEIGSLILDFFPVNSEVRNNYKTIENKGLGLTLFEVDLAPGNLPFQQVKQIMTDYMALHPEITHTLYFFPNGIVIPVSGKNGIKFPNLSFNLAQNTPQRLTILLKTLTSERTLELADELEGYLQDNLKNRKNPYVTGAVPLYTRGQKRLFVSLVRSFTFAFLSVSIIMGISLRSPYLGLLAIIPNILPVFFILAAMAWLGISLSVATVTVASIVFGIVVDDTIHFLHRLKKESTQISTEKRLQNTISHVGPAIITTSLVAGTGFLGFLAAPFIPLRSFGLLIAAALFLALVCDMILLPALILVWNRK